MEYDETIIVRMAADLYAEARNTEIGGALLGAFVGGSLAVGGLTVAGGAFDGSLMCAGGGAAVVGLLLGYLLARPKAFALRLQAQQAMVLVQIERNTRR